MQKTIYIILLLAFIGCRDEESHIQEPEKIATTLRLRLTLPEKELPEKELPEFTKNSANHTNRTNRTDTKATSVQTRTHDYSLRATAEVYHKGSNECLLRHSSILSGHTFDLSLAEGDYNILLWTDYVPEAAKSHRTDHYYTTTDLTYIQFSETLPYTANSDSRDAYALSFEAQVSGGKQFTEKAITLERPLAKYQLLATDIKKYRIFERINDYPPMEELTVTVSYDGFFPNRFDVSTNMPTDAVMGIAYKGIVQPTAESPDSIATIGSDYVFVNGSESEVQVTITITDNKGKTIARVPNVKIPYRRDRLTTLKGEFLTAGITTAGIVIDPDWEGELPPFHF